MVFKKPYTLKQQTPIIHFQYDQAGATLRATEVKPKLDAFILKKVGEETARNKGWFIGDTTALDYKMRFCSPGEERVNLDTREYDIYYGNMGEKTIFVEGIFAEGRTVTMEIICFRKELRETIDMYLENFFNVTNFGRMQNKGFGSFILEPKAGERIAVRDLKIKKQLCEQYGASHCYSFPAGSKCFRRIKTVYSIIKSGLNHSGYRRSLLFYYMHDMAIGNEKAWLKQTGIAPSEFRSENNRAKYKTYRDSTGAHECFYVRALLGVGDKAEYRSGDGKETISMNCTETDKQNKPLIERLPSPIFFKVIGDTVYYVGGRILSYTRRKDDTPTEIWGREFKFENKDTAKPPLSIKVPKKGARPCFNENFMDGFLEYCFKELNSTNPRGGQETPLTEFPDMQGVTIKQYTKN
ncbi:MAG: hypothetical protein IJD59_09280 [Clostridia bacterium]|nr:hypothetical protein [Clostridia bacterium]